MDFRFFPWALDRRYLWSCSLKLFDGYFWLARIYKFYCLKQNFWPYMIVKFVKTYPCIIITRGWNKSCALSCVFFFSFLLLAVSVCVERKWIKAHFLSLFISQLARQWPCTMSHISYARFTPLFYTWYENGGHDAFTSSPRLTYTTEYLQKSYHMYFGPKNYVHIPI